MKRILFSTMLICMGTMAFTQIDMEQLALDVSNAEAANTEQLKNFIWKRHSTATIDGEVKATMITEFSFDENGEIQTKQVGGESNVKMKRGIRGRIQQNAIENKVDYLENALELAMAYTYMSKGQLLDFFEKGTATEQGNTIEVTAGNVYMEGDSLTVLLNMESKLFINKKFSSLLGEDPISGEIKYDLFSSGINH